MPLITLIAGILLDLVGIVGFFATGQESPTALIPSVFGTILVVCGILAMVKPSFRKHAMHVAAAVALLAVLGTVRGVFELPALMSGGEVERPQAVVAQSVTALISAIFVILCVMSFVKARRAGAVKPGM
jgi:amino acid permease